MTSEEIIQRLLDQKKITVKEAMIILKDLAKISLQEGVKKMSPWIEPYIPTNPTTPVNPYPITVMYGVGIDQYTYGTTTSASSISYNQSEETGSKKE